MEWKKILILILFFGMLSFAHQPRIVEDPGIVKIQNPEVSQAFYGELNGSPARFEIQSDMPFEMYVGITVPATMDAKKDFSAQVSKDGTQVMFLNASKSNWAYFYEEFGGDGYYTGPQGKMNLSAGVYEIEVSNPGNMGKYVLVVGEKEEFPPGETINALVSLPTMKSRFFDKSPLDVLTSKIYLFTLAPVLLILLMLVLVFWYFKIRNRNVKITKKKKSQ